MSGSQEEVQHIGILLQRTAMHEGSLLTMQHNILVSLRVVLYYEYTDHGYTHSVKATSADYTIPNFP